MLKKLTGKSNRSHKGLKDRIAHIPPCYWECRFACEIEPGGDRYVLEAVEEVKLLDFN